MEVHRANLEAQSQAAALLSCQPPNPAANPALPPHPHHPHHAHLGATPAAPQVAPTAAAAAAAAMQTAPVGILPNGVTNPTNAAAIQQQLFLLQQQQQLKQLFLPNGQPTGAVNAPVNSVAAAQQPLKYVIPSQQQQQQAVAANHAATVATAIYTSATPTFTPTAAGNSSAGGQPLPSTSASAPNPASSSALLYHVTPKLKAAAGLMGHLSTAGAADHHKFAPY